MVERSCAHGLEIDGCNSRCLPGGLDFLKKDSFCFPPPPPFPITPFPFFAVFHGDVGGGGVRCMMGIYLFFPNMT